MITEPNALDELVDSYCLCDDNQLNVPADASKSGDVLSVELSLKDKALVKAFTLITKKTFAGVTECICRIKELICTITERLDKVEASYATALQLLTARTENIKRQHQLDEEPQKVLEYICVYVSLIIMNFVEERSN